MIDYSSSLTRSRCAEIADHDAGRESHPMAGTATGGEDGASEWGVQRGTAPPPVLSLLKGRVYEGAPHI